MSSSESPDFIGKVIAVKYGSAANRDYCYVQVMGLELQAGRQFLIGKLIKTQFQDVEGIRVCIDWDAVTAYYEFESVEELVNCMDIWYPPTKAWTFKDIYGPINWRTVLPISILLVTAILLVTVLIAAFSK